MSITTEYIEADKATVTKAAMTKGVFNNRLGDAMCAAYWEYMFHSEEDIAHFRNRYTKRYIAVQLKSGKRDAS